ncbi:MAG: DJ-1/PfpI family protein [bacterium]
MSALNQLAAAGRVSRRLGLALGLLLAAATGAAQINPATAARTIDPGPVTDPTRRVAVFVPPVLFDETEFQHIHRALVHAGWRPVIVGTDTAIASGFEHTLVRPEVGRAELTASDFAGLVLVGGSGAALLWQDSALFATARDFAEAGKPVAAAGLAVPILARAGLLDGRATAFFPDPAAIELITRHGARFVHAPVVTDRGIITTATVSDRGRRVARRFVAALIAALEAER